MVSKIAQNERFITIKSNFPKAFYDEIFRNTVFHLKKLTTQEQSTINANICRNETSSSVL